MCEKVRVHEYELKTCVFLSHLFSSVCALTDPKRRKIINLQNSTLDVPSRMKIEISLD